MSDSKKESTNVVHFFLFFSGLKILLNGLPILIRGVNVLAATGQYEGKSDEVRQRQPAGEQV